MNLWLLGGRMEEGIVRKFGVDMYTHHFIFKMDNHKNLLYSTWNSAQCYMAAWMGGEFGGLYMYD